MQNSRRLMQNSRRLMQNIMKIDALRFLINKTMRSGTNYSREIRGVVIADLFSVLAITRVTMDLLPI